MDLTAAPPDHAGPDATDALDTLATAYWDAYLEGHPTFATAIGDPTTAGPKPRYLVMTTEI